MLYNYLLIHLRSLMKRPLLTGINLVGLTLGIAACIISFLHIQQELAFDKHIERGDKLYRLVNGDVAGGDGWVKVSAPIPPYLADNIPEIANYARLAKITYNPKISVRHGNEVFNEENFFMADPAILEMFEFDFVSGNKKRALENPGNVIISDRISKKYFGDDNPIGQLLEVGENTSYQVAGVFVDQNDRSHMDIDFIIDFKNLETVFPGTSLTGNWGQYNYYAFVELASTDNRIEEVVESKIKTMKIDVGDYEHGLEEMNLQPLYDIHFTANRGNAKASYDIKYLYIYAAVALAVLLISIINFINLTIAGSTKRIKEVGVRKVVGANRPQLILQYISESMITALLAMTIALVISKSFLIPYVNGVMNSQMLLDLTNPVLLATLFSTLIVISLLSGFYIAIFVTGFKPSRALRGSIKIGQQGKTFKNILLGAQFAISIILILSSVLIYRQMEHLQKTDLGLNPEQVINISLYNKTAKESAGRLKESLDLLPFVQSSTATRFTAGKANWHQTTWWEGQTEEESMSIILADEGFIETLELEILEGDQKILSSTPEQGEIRYIINRSARDHIGWDNALGKSFQALGDNSTFPIIGVVEDFNYQSLHQQIDPVILAVYKKVQPGQLMLRLTTDNYQEAISDLESEFNKILPDTPFEYHFLDDQFAQLYTAENRTKKIIGFITFLAIVLALMGLYGLVSFAIQERTKEMAIRKVLGIHQGSILRLISMSYLRILILANVLAIPIVWYAIENWLINFNYRIDISPLILIGGSLIIWLFVLATLGLNVYQVSRIDPVDGLRHE